MYIIKHSFIPLGTIMFSYIQSFSRKNLLVAITFFAFLIMIMYLIIHLACKLHAYKASIVEKYSAGGSDGVHPNYMEIKISKTYHGGFTREKNHQKEDCYVVAEDGTSDGSTKEVDVHFMNIGVGYDIYMSADKRTLYRTQSKHARPLSELAFINVEMGSRTVVDIDASDVFTFLLSDGTVYQVNFANGDEWTSVMVSPPSGYTAKRLLHDLSNTSCYVVFENAGATQQRLVALGNTDTSSTNPLEDYLAGNFRITHGVRMGVGWSLIRLVNGTVTQYHLYGTTPGEASSPSFFGSYLGSTLSANTSDMAVGANGSDGRMHTRMLALETEHGVDKLHFMNFPLGGGTRFLMGVLDDDGKVELYKLPDEKESSGNDATMVPFEMFETTSYKVTLHENSFKRVHTSNTMPHDHSLIFTNYRLETKNTLRLPDSNKWGISFWMKLFFIPTKNVEAYLFHWGYTATGGHRAFALAPTYNGKKAFGLRSGQFNSWDYEYEVGQWYHVVMTSSGGDDIQKNTLMLYVNGQKIDITLGGTDKPRWYESNTPLRIGGAGSRPGRDKADSLGATLDASCLAMYQLAIYDKGLSEDDVNELYEKIHVKDTNTSPIALYEFKSDNPLADTSESGLDYSLKYVDADDDVYDEGGDKVRLGPPHPISETYGENTKPNTFMTGNNVVSDVVSKLSHTDDWSVASWIRIPSETTDTYITSWGTGSHRSVHINPTYMGDGRYGGDSVRGPGIGIRTGQFHFCKWKYEANTWYHLVVTSRQSVGEPQKDTLLFYIDGVLLDVTYGGTLQSHNYTPTSLSFSEKLEYHLFSFYDRSITQEEVTKLHAFKEVYDGRIALYKFNNEKDKLKDSSGEGNDLKIKDGKDDSSSIMYSKPTRPLE